MAFSVKYSKKFQRIGITTTYRVDILSEAGGAVIVPWKMGADPFHVKTLGTERDEEKIVIGSEIAFEFVLKKHAGESDYDALFESEYRDHIVKFYNDDTSTLLWQGYLQPENMYKSVFESNLHIYLSASDALKDLSDYEFLSGGAIVTGRLSGLAIIKLCLSNLDQDSQFQYSFLVKLGTKHTGQGANDTALKDVTHDCRRFSKVENGKTTVDNCLTVIEKVLTPYSCQLFQWGGKYYIKNRHEAATSYYTYNWALTFQSKANSADVVNVDTLKFKRDAEQSLLAPVKEIGIKLLNRNTGAELVATINTFGVGTPWDFSGFPGGDVIDEAPNLHIVLDDGNEANDRDITLTAAFAINKVTANDYLKLKFKFKATNTQHSNIDSPKLIITVTKPDGTASTWEEYIINSWRMYESPNNEVFFVTEDGDYNITITFEQSTAAAAPYTEDVYLTDFSLTKIVAIEDTTYSDITFDTYFKAVSNVGKKVKAPVDFYFGDSPGTGDLAALVYGGVNTSEWDRTGVDDNKALLEIYSLNYLTNRKAYSKYLILTVKDASDGITPVNYITFGGDTYDVVSFNKSYRFSWVTLHLKQRLTGDVTMTFNEVPLTSIDGEKVTNDSLVVTGESSFPGAGIAVSTGTAWGTSIASNYFAPAASPTFTGKVSITVGSGFEIEFTGAEAGNIHHATAGQSILLLAPTSGSIHLGSNGTNSQVVLTAGNLGVASTTPTQARLVVADDDVSTDYSGQILITGLTNTNKRLGLGYDTTSDFGFIQPYINSGGDAGRLLALCPNGGNATIGFTSSSARFAVNGGAHIGGTTDPGDNNLLVDGTSKLVGNVRIGDTTAPTEKLEVAGNAIITGSLMVYSS